MSGTAVTVSVVGGGEVVFDGYGMACSVFGGKEGFETSNIICCSKTKSKKN